MDIVKQVLDKVLSLPRKSRRDYPIFIGDRELKRSQFLGRYSGVLICEDRIKLVYQSKEIYPYLKEFIWNERVHDVICSPHFFNLNSPNRLSLVLDTISDLLNKADLPQKWITDILNANALWIDMV